LRLLRSLLVFSCALAIPAPDGPVMRPTILFAFEVEAWNAAKNVQPLGGVAADFDLRLHRPKRVERLVQQVPHDASLGRFASGADVVDRQVIVNTHVAFDETGNVPLLSGTIETFQQQDVAAARGTAIAFAMALLIRMCQGGADGSAQRRGVARLGSPDTVRQTSLFHAAACVPTE
jgi:hypothetical protein